MAISNFFKKATPVNSAPAQTGAKDLSDKSAAEFLDQIAASEPATPLTPYAKAKHDLENFRCTDWHAKGRSVGLQRHSSEKTRENEVEAIIQSFVDIYIEIHKGVTALLLNADLDVLSAGTQGDSAAIAQTNKEYLEKELQRSKEQIEMQHVSDKWSECGARIRLFRNGFEEGQRIRLLNAGNYH